MESNISRRAPLHTLSRCLSVALALGACRVKFLRTAQAGASTGLSCSPVCFLLTLTTLTLVVGYNDIETDVALGLN